MTNLPTFIVVEVNGEEQAKDNARKIAKALIIWFIPVLV
jgi:hypothetical protein